MRPLSARPPRPRHDGQPAADGGRAATWRGPSRLAFRARRLWAKPAIRNSVLVYAPLAAVALVGWRLASSDTLREMARTEAETLYEAFAARPEFAVAGIEIEGVGLAVRAQIRAALKVTPGASSLRFEVSELRRRVEAIGAVKTASVRFDSQGILRIDAVERMAAALYRGRDDVLSVIDREGMRIGTLSRRADRADLPLLMGDGAPAAAAEALDLLAGAPDVLPRLRALVRVGERRWNLVLAEDLTVMLPADGPERALHDLIELDDKKKLLDRDLAVIDLRLSDRPTVRMTPRAVEWHRLQKQLSGQLGEDT